MRQAAVLAAAVTGSLYKYLTSVTNTVASWPLQCTINIIEVEAGGLNLNPNTPGEIVALCLFVQVGSITGPVLISWPYGHPAR
jgi:hypothetical protein